MSDSKNFENAYNASRQPITGFNIHRLYGVEQYKRQDHFLYLKQFEKDGKNVGGAGNNQFGMDPQRYANIKRLEKVSKMVQPANKSRILAKSRRCLSVVVLCSSVSFAIACTIGAYW